MDKTYTKKEVIVKDNKAVDFDLYLTRKLFIDNTIATHLKLLEDQKEKLAVLVEEMNAVHKEFPDDVPLEVKVSFELK